MITLAALGLREWSIAVLAALCVGLAKSGFAGFGMIPIVLMTQLFPARESTGALLPLLIFGDVFAVGVYRRHAHWRHVWRLLPPAVLGIVAGWLLMGHLRGQAFRPIMGWIVLFMVVLHVFRRVRPDLFKEVPHTLGFAWTMGGWAGLTTMMANAAGPVMTLYLIAVGLPKLAFVGTSAWFFLIVNLAKVPFSLDLGLITASTFTLNVLLIPAIGLGVFLGRRLIDRVSQRLFETLALIFAALASLRLIVG